jgi:LacI family gluconate utilization system Gnt-I transcriptional repressor
VKENRQKKSSTSLSKIAEAAGVSKMPVSRVLRDADGFSEATRERVMREVERSNYLPNRLAAAFGPASNSTLVGVCVPRLSSHLFGLVLESVDRSFQRFGYQTIIGSHYQSPDEEERWLKSILSWRPAGVLLTNKSHTNGTHKLLGESDIPVVELWNLNTSPLDMSVGFNEFDSGFQMSQHAILKGYSKAGILGANQDGISNLPERFDGFSQGFRDKGGKVVRQELLNDLPGFYAGYYGTENLLNHTQDIDMIYYQNDTMALGGLTWCQRKGMRIPEDIGIAGWGGHEAASILVERLTTTTVPMRQIGKLSAEVLFRKLRNEAYNEVTAVPTKLVEGNTL